MRSCTANPIFQKLNGNFDPVISILFASFSKCRFCLRVFSNPIQLALSPVGIKKTMSHFNKELLPQLKPSACKRRRLDFAADLRRTPTPSRTLVGALLSIRDDAVQQVHKNMKQMIECFLHVPDKQNNAPSWCRKAFSRCAAACANTARARKLASAYLKLDAARMRTIGENTLATHVARAAQ